jgi:transposase
MSVLAVFVDVVRPGVERARPAKKRLVKRLADPNRDHLRYPSDLTDYEWAHVEPFHSTGEARRWRAVMNGVMYILSTGCPVALPSEGFSAAQHGHNYFIWWQCDGVLDRIHHALYVECREKVEREASPTACIIDSQIVNSPLVVILLIRAHQIPQMPLADDNHVVATTEDNTTITIVGSGWCD